MEKHLTCSPDFLSLATFMVSVLLFLALALATNPALLRSGAKSAPPRGAERLCCVYACVRAKLIWYGGKEERRKDRGVVIRGGGQGKGNE